VLGLSQDGPESTRILEDFLTFMKGLISFPLYIPGSPYARAVKVFYFILFLSFLFKLIAVLHFALFSLCLQARARISLTVKAIIEKRRENGGDSNKKGDFLDVLLSLDSLSEEEKVSFVLDALLGGYETTSLLMSMAVYFLGQSSSSLDQLKVILFIFYVLF